MFAPQLWGADPPARPLKVTAVYTVFRHRSHAQNILENFLQPYLFNGTIVDPGMDVVSFYADQRAPEGDRTDEVARKFNVPVHKSISDALTLGGKNLACDAVLLVGEHGDYPVNKLGQIEYPRKRFFDEIVAAMRASDRFVPVFNDKHLAYKWDWSKEMYDTARKHRFPLMAGSSVPLGQRVPALELPAEPEIEDVVAFYDSAGRRNPGLDPMLTPLHLTPDESRAIVAFLATLTSGQSAQLAARRF